jgi:hypothetical protein
MHSCLLTDIVQYWCCVTSQWKTSNRASNECLFQRVISDFDRVKSRCVLILGAASATGDANEHFQATAECDLLMSMECGSPQSARAADNRADPSSLTATEDST